MTYYEIILPRHSSKSVFEP